MSAREVAAALDGTGRAEADLGAAHESGGVGSLSEHRDDTATTDDWSIAREISAAVPRVGVPVTVLTGFLGAGKTTVLNYLLRQDHGLRIAVFVNEFGEVDIDSQIVASESVEREDMILLKNGCICCTISNSFVESVQRVLEGHAGSRPDYLVIETSGVADPAPIITNLQETELDDVLYLDQVLTVVDALNFYAQEMDSATARSQMSCADVILLSKSDLVAPEQAEAVSAELGRLKPGVRIVPSRRGRVPVSVLFDVGVEGADTGGPGAGGETPAAKSTTTPSQPIHDRPSDNSRHPSHLNDDGFQSFSFVSSRPFDLKKFRSGFLKELPPNVYRSKGLLWFAAYPMRFVFQLSGRRFQIEQDEWPPGTARSNQLVLIGRDLDSVGLRKMLDSCLVYGEERQPGDFKVLQPASARQ